MALKTYKPVTNAQRQLVLVDRSGLHKGPPVKALTSGQKRMAGRNNTGRVVVRWQGGGHKQSYRIVDFKRARHDEPATVQHLEYDPNRTSFIALIKYKDGTQSYILAPQRLNVGDTVVSGDRVDVKVGNAMPLGAMPVDVDAVAHAIEMPDTCIHEAAHAREHAIEVQLPFLQVVLEAAAIVPLLVGLAEPPSVARLMRHLWGGEETVFVISSDLSHYLSDATARAVDRASVEHILARRPVLDHEAACGAIAINAALTLAGDHGLRPRLLSMCNSGDASGDRDKVVGYCALAFEESP